MFSFFKNLFDYNAQEVNKLRLKIEEINQLEDKARVLKEEEFITQTNELKEAIQSGKKTLDEALPWAYALVREASRRLSGERHFDEQLMAGIVLHQGKVAEQKTGEGKTLSATLPLYLNALAGKGVHLVTVNDYLARRDAGWMGQIFHFLGLSISAIIAEKSYFYDPAYSEKDISDWRLANLREISRQEAYRADITYGINSEFGFDYLRDNMSYRKDDMRQRGFHFAIIDEVDSVLIDEARTPHIISAPYDEDVSKYYDYARIVGRLDRKKDFVMDEKTRTAHLTEEGIFTIEKFLQVSNIYEKDFDTLFHIEAALKAHTLFKKDKDYIISGTEVVIVDEFTGRLLHGRRFSEGLHQAIEAKEQVPIKRESKTLATVSLQNYFRMYRKLAGMTGTAVTEAEEFHKIYKLDVVVLPTHRKMVRHDHPDFIYKTEQGKFNALVETVAQEYQKGRPVLVGTTSIEKNERLSFLLKKKGIPHELLNAKNHEREAFIIGNAGKKNAVTVATNMAGRGVDIILGGQPPNKYKVENQKLKVDAERHYEKEMREWRKAHDEVVSLGGLYVMGTERHESRRIDNQLRGRSGRQGDPGETRFFVSLEDDLMRIFGGAQVARLMTFFKIPEDQPLEHAIVSKALEQAQVKVEGFNFDIRKHLVDFDDVLNKQREILYKLRRKTLHEDFFKVFQDEVNLLVGAYVFEDRDIDYESLSNDFATIIPLDKKELLKEIATFSSSHLQETLYEKICSFYRAKEKEVGPAVWTEITKSIFLTTVDTYWTEHLTAIEDLREGINLRGFAQLDPLVEYKNEAFSMFEKLLGDIKYEFTRRILHIQVEQKVAEQNIESPQRQKSLEFKSASSVNPFAQSKKETGASSGRETPSRNQGIKVRVPGATIRKLGRNEPCWCGSGKKYKKCHLYKDSS